MNENDRVNHPSHYEKGNGHTESIYLLSILTERFSGIYAGCVMQAKYLYRAGSKSEEGISIFEKSIEDIKKFRFYWSKIVENKEECIKSMKPRFNPLMEKVLIEKLVEEFTFDKPIWEKDYYENIITNILTLECASQIDIIMDCLNVLINKLSEHLK